MTYRLTRRCERDIERIHLHGAEKFGVGQAERYLDDLRATFELLGANPRLARERSELRRPVRLHPHRAHLIAYVEDTGHFDRPRFSWAAGLDEISESLRQ